MIGNIPKVVKADLFNRALKVAKFGYLSDAGLDLNGLRIACHADRGHQQCHQNRDDSFALLVLLQYGKHNDRCMKPQ